MIHSFKEYIAEAEDYIKNPATGDVFEIEIARDETLISGYITECIHNGIIVDLDDDAVNLLEGYGYINEGVMSEVDIDLHDIADSGDKKQLVDALNGSRGRAVAIVLQNMMDNLSKELSANNVGELVNDPEKMIELMMDQLINYYRARELDEKMDEAEYQGRDVPLGKPMRGDVKKFKVYVRKPNGNVVKVNFGDPNMRIKKSNPARRRSFRARHHCDSPGPRHKARYWACRSW